MKSVALVSLECDTGTLRRYLRVEGNKPEKTGEDKFKRWIVAREREDDVFGLIQAYRVGYVPPEPPPPRPTSPMKSERRAAA